MALDRDRGRAGGQIHQPRVFIRGLTRFRVIEREGAEHFTGPGKNRRRPAGLEPVAQGERGKVAPERVGRDVAHQDRLFVKAAVPQEPTLGPIATPSIARL